MIWPLIKAFLSKYATPKLFLGLLFLGMALTVYVLNQRLAGVRQEYKQHLISDDVAAKAQAVENGLKEKATKQAVAKALSAHRDVMRKLQVNNDKLKKDVEDLYAIKINRDFKLSAYADRVLLETGDSRATSKATSDTERLAECRRERDAADTRLSVIEEAAAITTADFNLCRGWIDGVCDSHDCGGS